MRKRLLGLGLLVAVVLAASGASAGAPSNAPAPTASPLVDSVSAGKETFTRYCSICHAAGATGFIGPHIAGVNWTVPGLQAIVRGGVGGYGSMPAFNADAVTDKNIADIAAYLASLAPASAPKASSQPQLLAAAAPPAAAPAATAPAASGPAVVAPPPPAPANVATPAATAEGANPIHGRQVYSANCAACHGATGQGGIGPSLRGEKSRKDTAAAVRWIKNPKLPMPKLYPEVLSAKDVDDVAAFIESL